MQRRRHPIVLADLEAQAFGDQAPRAPLSAGAALATADAAALVSTSTDTADVSTPALTSPPSTRVRQRQAKAETRREGGLPEKKA